jgi:hypothetical protein
VRVEVRIALPGRIVVEPADDQVARAMLLRAAGAGPDGDEPLRDDETERSLDGRAVGGLDRRALLGRAGHPKHGNRLPGCQGAVDPGPVTGAGAADQRLAGAWMDPRTQVAERGRIDRSTVAHDRLAAAPPHPAAVCEVVLVASIRPGLALAVLRVVRRHR